MIKKKFKDELEDIPLENLPDSGLVVFNYDTEWKEGDAAKCDNVLIPLLGTLDTICLVAQDKNGEMIYAAGGIKDPFAIIRQLDRFREVLEDYIEEGYE